MPRSLPAPEPLNEIRNGQKYIKNRGMSIHTRGKCNNGSDFRLPRSLQTARDRSCEGTRYLTRNMISVLSVGPKLNDDSASSLGSSPSGAAATTPRDLSSKKKKPGTKKAAGSKTKSGSNKRGRKRKMASCSSSDAKTSVPKKVKKANRKSSTQSSKQPNGAAAATGGAKQRSKSRSRSNSNEKESCGTPTGTKEDKNKMLARKWGFKPGTRWFCPAVDRVGQVLHVKDGRLVLTFDDKNSRNKHLTKAEALRMKPWVPKRRLTRGSTRMEKSLSKEEERRIEREKKREKRKERFKPKPKLTRRDSIDRSQAEMTKSGTDYQYMTQMGQCVAKGLGRLGDIQHIPPENMGKFSAYTYGFGLELKRTTIPGTTRRNRGLFATVDMPKNTLITEYSGKSINREQAMELRRQKRATHIKGLNYDLFLDGNRWPTIGQGLAQMANDGLGSFPNNSKFVVKYDSIVGRDRCFLKALVDIKQGEEIFVSYGRGFWQHV